MNSLSARETKHDLKQLIDTALPAPAVIEKNRAPIVFVLSSVVSILSTEEYERLKTIDRKKEAA
jgi:hypothetical protein